MAAEQILSVLRFTGPVVALASALWSTTQKITYEAEGGAKRLTLQGRVLIGITVLATLISLVSLGLEAMVNRERAWEESRAREKAEQKERDEKRDLETRQRAEKAEDERKRQEDLLREIKAEAELQSGIVGQRLLIIANAAEAQRRDAQISRQIALEANRRLSEAERTLAEFERINYPLQTVEVEAGIALDLAGLDLSGFWRDMEAIVRERRARSHHPNAFSSVAELPAGAVGAYGELNRIAAGFSSEFAFLTPGGAFAASAAVARDEIRPSEVAASDQRPIKLFLRFERIEADVATKRVVAIYKDRRSFEGGLLDSGEKVSISDVLELVPVLVTNRKLRKWRADHILDRISYSLNGFKRFEASSSLRLVDAESFILDRAAQPR